jgi:O-antigen/teichoic acid export membrane protein
MNPHLWRDASITIALVSLGLGGRAVVDKLLALTAPPAAVAQWAQLLNLVDLPTAAVMAGVGQGVCVLAARRDAPEDRVIGEGMVLGLLLSGAASLFLYFAMPFLGQATGREIWPGARLGALALADGVSGVVMGVLYFYWQGVGRRGAMLLLQIAGVAPLLVAALGAFGDVDVEKLLWAQLCAQTALSIYFLVRRWRAAAAARLWASPLVAYIPAGLSIGLLSPLSMIWMRADMAKTLSWDDVARLQALWRVDDWITNIAGAILGLYFFPAMSRAHMEGGFRKSFLRALTLICLPTFGAAALLFALQPVIIPLFYRDAFLMPAAASALFLLGDSLRVTAWVGLQGLFASGQVKAIAIGEWLSLPMFAALITFIGPTSLVGVCACYAFTYVVYSSFNFYYAWRAGRNEARSSREFFTPPLRQNEKDAPLDVR